MYKRPSSDLVKMANGIGIRRFQQPVRATAWQRLVSLFQGFELISKWAVYAQYAYGEHERGEILSVHRTHQTAEKAARKSANPTYLALAEVPAQARPGWRHTGDAIFEESALPPRGPGRPQMGKEARQRYQIMLEPRLREKAERIGNGNVSAGITRVLEEYTG